MNEFEIVAVIDCPVPIVFGGLVDVEKSPDWNPGVDEVRRTSDGALGVGSTVTFIGRFLGRHFESPSECTAFLVDHQFTTKTSSGPFDLEVGYTLEPVDGGTRVTTVYRGESKGFFKIAEPVVFRLTKNQAEKSMETLKELLEADAI